MNHNILFDNIENVICKIKLPINQHKTLLNAGEYDCTLFVPQNVKIMNQSGLSTAKVYLAPDVVQKFQDGHSVCEISEHQEQECDKKEKVPVISPVPSHISIDSSSESKEEFEEEERWLKKANLDSEELGKLQSFLDRIEDPDSIIIQKKQKQSDRKGKRGKTRSRFIGVTKNCKSWQAMLTIKGRKTYLGSFKIELNAAIAYDFYSILLNRNKAPTNFNYSKSGIMDMLDNYVENGNEFDAKKFCREFAHNFTRGKHQ